MLILFKHNDQPLTNATVTATFTGGGKRRHAIKQHTGCDGVVVIPLPEGQLESLQARRDSDGATVMRAEAVSVPPPSETDPGAMWRPLRIVVAGGDTTRFDQLMLLTSDATTSRVVLLG